MVTPQQIKSARGLLQWSEAKLAQKAGVQVSTVMRAERTWGERMITQGNLDVIKRTLEAAGVLFIDSGEDPGVRLSGRRVD